MRLSYCHLFILALLFISIHSNVNYVVNGQFSQPNISNTQFTQQSSGIINGWFGSVIETGLGSAYNAYWQPQLPVLNLDTGVNQAITQTVSLPSPGIYTVSFRWAPHWQSYASSLGLVTFAGTTKLIKPEDDVDHWTSFDVEIAANSLQNNLVFQGAGTVDGLGLTIAQVSIVRANRIINGDFQYPPQNGIVSLQSSGILGWQATTVFIEHGSRFNPNWHTGQVIQTVVSNGNMSYTTTCNNLEADKTYLLQFNWAAHVGVPLKEQSAIVRWNGAAIITITPTDQGLHNEQMPVKADGNKNTLTFEGASISKIGGISFDNVVLKDVN